MRVLLILLFVVQISAFAGDYYVDSQNGSDVTGDGSQSNPWQTIQHAFDNVSAYDGNGVDTLNLIGEFIENAIAQGDDDNITILTSVGTNNLTEYCSIDVSNASGAYISITTWHGTKQI